VAVFVEFEAAAALGAIDRPAGEDARSLDDVGLRITAVDAEGMQFHQLAGVVFIEPFRRLFVLCRIARGGDFGFLRGGRIRADTG